MSLGEIYIKLVVGFPRDPKVRALVRYGTDAGLARDLYVQMCLYCKENLTDGFVPAEEVGVLVYPLDPEHGNQLAKQLASVGLIKEVSKTEASDKQGSEGGWQLCAYLKRNGTKEDVERLSQIRAEAGRTGGIKSRKRPAQRPPKVGSKQLGYQFANQDAQQTGSNAVSVSVRPNGLTESRDIQTPTVSADAEPETVGQRTNRLAKFYTDQVPISNFPAIAKIVRKAVDADVNDEAITAGLSKVIADGVSLTTESLRIAIYGPPKATDRRQQATDELFDRAMQRAQAREAAS